MSLVATFVVNVILHIALPGVMVPLLMAGGRVYITLR